MDVVETKSGEPSLMGATSHVGARAVIAGVLVTLGIEVLFALFGLAVGVTAGGSAQGVGLWLVIWTLAGICVASYFGGRVAASASGLFGRRDGLLNGFVTWAATALFMTMLVSGALSSVIGGALGLAGQTAQTAAQTAAQNPQAQSAAQQALEQARQAMQNNPNALSSVVHGARQAAGLSTWYLFVLYSLSLIAALVGGLSGARGGKLIERRRHAIPTSREGVARREIRETTVTTAPTDPERPVPIT